MNKNIEILTLFFLMNIFEEVTLTSSRLRIEAIKMITEEKRPLSAEDIRQLIRKNEPELWRAVEVKCSDYVRIVLSITKKSLLKKFKNCRKRRGVDKRTIFFGLPNEKYSEDEWIQVLDDKNITENDSLSSSNELFDGEVEENVQKNCKNTNSIFGIPASDQEYFLRKGGKINRK